MSDPRPLVIIGSGLAGYMLAKEWRKLNTQTPLIIITADDGSFYSKPLLSTALAQQKTLEQLVLADAKTMAADLRATILTYTKVLAIDSEQQQVVLADDHMDYAQLVLACGADIIHPPLSGNAVAELQTVNDLSGYRNFRQWLQRKQHIAILGAGLVGCEFANDLVQAGYHVTLIAPDHHLLSTFMPAAMGHVLQQRFMERGVHCQLGEFAVAVHHAERGYHVELQSGRMIYADGVFSAVGLRPQLRLAQSAGLAVNRGIMVNRWLQTSNPNIYALGDCAEVDHMVKQYVAPILQCARTLAKNLAGGSEPVHYPIMPIVIKTSVLPLVAYPPPAHVVGEWVVEGENQHLRALFHDAAGQLRGYVLAGDKVRDKLSLAKQLPVVFAEEC